MDKLVILKLDGNLEGEGFRVTLEVRLTEGQTVEKMGYLPANPKLAEFLREHWQDKYRVLGAPYRIRPISINRHGSINERIQQCKKSAQELKSHLSEWLSAESFRRVDKTLREVCDRNEQIRVLIKTEDITFKKLPLHLWDFFENYPKAEFGFSPLEAGNNSQGLTGETDKFQVRILAILGNSEGIDTDADLQLLESLPNADIVFLVEPKRQQISEQLWEQNWDIIFFAGHSKTEGDKGRIYINPTENLTIDELWFGLRKAVDNGLQLAIFNSCDGLGLASQLDDLDIPQMIVMRELIPDFIAQTFLKHFLKTFAEGKSFYLAVKEARQRLHDDCDGKFPCASWLPVICQHPTAVPPTWESLAAKSSGANSENTAFEAIDWKSKISLNHLKLITCLLVVAISGYIWGLPKISDSFNEQGRLRIAEQKPQAGIFYLKLALQFNRNNSNAHNNLGLVYEALNEDDLAMTHFKKSKLLGNLSGCNAEAFMNIKHQKYEKAVSILRPCLTEALKGDNTGRKYAMLKNLSWALLEKPGDLKFGEYTEAEENLRQAINLLPKVGSARCLLAQVLEAKGESGDAIAEWKYCLEYARDDLPEEADWKNQARQKLDRSQGE